MCGNISRSLVAVVVVVGLVLWAPSAAGVVAGQSAPSSYYGAAVMEDGSALPAGTTIIAVVDGDLQDRIDVDPAGQYGGSGPEDDKLRVATTDSTVRFYVEKDDGTWIEAFEADENPTAGTQQLDLTFPEGTISSESNFEVNDLQPTDATVLRGDTVNVTATITNRVDQGTQTVLLQIDGQDVRSHEVTLDTGEQVTLKFTDVETANLNLGDHTLGVYTDDDSRTNTLTVEAARPNFTVSAFDPGDVTVTDGETFDVVATVTNDGTASGSQTVAYQVGGETIESNKVTLDPGESTDVSFPGINSSQFGPGTYTHAVTTENDTKSGSLTVETFEPAEFVVSDLSPVNDTVTEGTFLDVSALVENVGDGTGTQKVRLDVDGNVATTEEISLESGASTTATFTLDTATIGLGAHTHAIVTANDSRSGTLTVEEADESPEFVISELDPASVSVAAGDPVAVSATVQNVGAEADTQQVRLDVGGDEVDSTETTLASGGSTSVTLNIDTEGLSAGTYTHTVVTANDSQSGSLTVEGVADPSTQFDISDLSPVDETTTMGTPVDVTVSVQNVGGEAGTQKVDLDVDGETIDSEDVSLESGASTTARFTVNTTRLGPGTYTHVVSSEDDARSGSMTVERFESAEFLVSNLEPVNASATVGASVNVSASVRNAGEGSGTQQLRLDVNGTEMASQELTLDSGETRTVTLALDTSPLAPGVYEHTLASENDSQNGNLTVRGATATPNVTSPNGTAQQQDEGGLLPLGLLWTLFLYVGIPLAIIYGALKALAVYLGY